MDMAKTCLRDGSSFGVCAITKGQEVGSPAAHELVGCEAKIVDWDMEQLGILQVRVQGLRRFNVLSSQTNQSGLVEAEVAFLAEEPDQVLPEEYVALAALAQRIVQDLEQRKPQAIQKMVELPYDYASARWVGHRLAEFLPLPLPIKHQMMVLNDPLGRLQVLKRFLQTQGVL
jgi:uncharacterized protein